MRRRAFWNGRRLGRRFGHATRIVFLARLVFPSGTRPDPGNAPLRDGERAVHDGAIGRTRNHGGELGVQPKRIVHLAMITA